MMTLQSAKEWGDEVGGGKEEKRREKEKSSPRCGIFPPLLTKHAHTSVFLCVVACVTPARSENKYSHDRTQ